MEKEYRVIKVRNATQDTVEFEENWFVEGDLLQDVNDPEHDIELVKQFPNNHKKFEYLGTAKPRERYKKVAHKQKLGLTDFVRQYIVIQDRYGDSRKFNETELHQIAEMEDMAEKGYHMERVKLRRGTKTFWVKDKKL